MKFNSCVPLSLCSQQISFSSLLILGMRPCVPVFLTKMLWVLADLGLASLCPHVPSQKINDFFRFE